MSSPSPEISSANVFLCRLKDSDVTWLYGPLHEHADPVPPPKQATARETLDLEDTHGPRTKSILKHRTISEMLTTPGRNASPSIDNSAQVSSGENSADSSDVESSRPSRPHLHIVKSETAITAPVRKRGGSPPASERLFRNMSTGDKTDGIPHAEERRHISFNQRVDQCIAVDSHQEVGGDSEDEEDDSEEEYDNGHQDEDDASSSDEDVLTMKSSPRTTNSWFTSSSREPSPGYDTQTIAKLAPTILKTSDTYPAPSPQVVDPSGFTSNQDEVRNAHQPLLSSQPHVSQYGHSDHGLMSHVRYSQWDADDESNGDFDYLYTRDATDKFNEGEQSSGADNVSREDRNTMVHQNDYSTSRPSDPTPNAAPKSILKRRAPPSSEEAVSTISNTAAFSPPSSPDSSTFSSALGDSERGRTQQRMGSSASYERLQDATKNASSTSVGRTRTNSGGTSTDSLVSDGATSPSSPPLSSRRDSFRGATGEGSRTMSEGVSTVAGAAIVSEGDTEHRGSLEFNSPGFPASPLLGDKDEGNDSSDEASLYGCRHDSSKWADKRIKQSSSKQYKRGEGEEEDDPSARLSVDLENLPCNTASPTGSAPGGPTPLNTPTFALARSQRGSKRGSDPSKAANANNPSAWQGDRGPESPTLPRRSSATGALVAPSDADKDAGVRVPLAHDYVEEDEGGIVGRAVEIVNTARDLIGALLGTGSDRGRSWREAN